jgi:hypothetical protein
VVSKIAKNEGFPIDVERLKEKIGKVYNEDDNLAHKATPTKGALSFHTK